MDRKLKRVLDKNPFTEKLVSDWRCKLAEIRKAHLHNSKIPAYDLEQHPFQFLLPNDSRVITRTIHTEYIPQPFIGHPCAPIWVLNQNPSFFPSDLFAMFDVSAAGVEVARRPIVTRRKSKQMSVRDVHSICDIKTNGTVDDCLKCRQELMLKQLRLVEPEFFALDEAFNIGEDLILDPGERFPSKTSIYSWWRAFIIGSSNEDFPFHRHHESGYLAKHIFVMEAFPYRSRNWNDAIDLWQRSCYHTFWKFMVKYAIKAGKTIIIRGSRNSELLRTVLKLGGSSLEHIFRFSSYQHPTMSYRNIVKLDGGTVGRRLIDSLMI